jgi:hypothetical protein
MPGKSGRTVRWLESARARRKTDVHLRLPNQDGAKSSKQRPDKTRIAVSEALAPGKQTIVSDPQASALPDD